MTDLPATFMYCMLPFALGWLVGVWLFSVWPRE